MAVVIEPADLSSPARVVDAANGFVETGPFGAYKPDPHSIFMTLPLTLREAVA